MSFFILPLGGTKIGFDPKQQRKTKNLKQIIYLVEPQREREREKERERERDNKKINCILPAAGSRLNLN